MATIRFIMAISVILVLRICAVTWALPAAWNAPSPNIESDILLKEAIHGVKRQEDAIGNIRIHAYSKMYGDSYDATTKKWIWHKRPFDETRLTVTYDGLPWGKFRAVVPLDFTLWPDGPIPVSADRYLVAYNGRVGTYLGTMVGSPKKLVPYNHGTISGNMPNIRGDIDATSGWRETLFGFTSYLPDGYKYLRFSAYISPGQKWAWVNACGLYLHGKKYIQVTRVGDPYGKDVFFLDPRRGYSVVEHDHYGWLPKKAASGRIYLVPGTQLMGYTTVKSFFEPAPGVFYPKRITGKVFDERVKRFRTQTTIIVSKVTVNDPTVNDKTYVIRFPRGAIVTDLVTGKAIRIGGTPLQQQDAIERAVQRARKGVNKPTPEKP